MLNSLILLSYPLSDSTPGYGGSKTNFSRKSRSSICCGQTSNSEVWEIFNHHGTHIDCPLHFCSGGKKLQDYEPEEWLFSSPYLITISPAENELVDLASVRDSIPLTVDCLIIKTGFETFRGCEKYWNNNPGLTPELGEWLKQNRPKISVIGFDFISLTSYQHREIGRAAHRAFLSQTLDHSGIRIIEDMKLSGLTKSPKAILVSPLFVEEADSGPVTVWCEV